MRIAYGSDLHIEFYHDEYKLRHSEGSHPSLGPSLYRVKENCDVLVLAGDVWNARYVGTYLKQVADFMEKPVIYVPGNHEFYGWDFDRALEVMKSETSGVDHLHFLTGGDYADLEDDSGTVRFVGATMWTDFGGEKDHEYHFGLSLNDFSVIRRGGGLFTTQEAVNENSKDVAGISESLSCELERKVVVTHHAPSFKCNQLYKESFITPCFLHDAESLMTDPALKLWIYGHTHDPADVTISDTKVVSSQRGYPGERSRMGLPEWDWGYEEV